MVQAEMNVNANITSSIFFRPCTFNLTKTLACTKIDKEEPELQHNADTRSAKKR